MLLMFNQLLDDLRLCGWLIVTISGKNALTNVELLGLPIDPAFSLTIYFRILSHLRGCVYEGSRVVADANLFAQSIHTVNTFNIIDTFKGCCCHFVASLVIKPLKLL